MSSLPFNFYGIAHVIYDGDLVHSRSGPLSIEKIDDYELTMLDTVSYESKTLYEIGYEPINGRKGNGSILIAKDSYAIVKMTHNLSKSELGGLFEDVGLGIRNLHRGFQKYQVDYRGNGEKWILNHVKFSTAFMQEDSLKIFSDIDFVITSVGEGRKKGQPNQNKIDYSDVLLVNEYGYDSTFWDGHNVTMPSNEVSNIIANTPLRSSEKTIQEKFSEILSSVRVTYSVGVFYGSQASADIRSVSSPSFSGFFKGGRFRCPVLSNGIGYDLKSGMSIDYLVASSFESKAFIERSLRFSKSLFSNLSRSRVSFIPSLAIGWQQWNNKVGEIRSEESFVFGGKDFDAKKIHAFYSSRGLTISPALRISVSNGKRMNFFIESGYNHISQDRSGLLLKEDKGFLKKNSFVVNGTELSIESDTDLISDNWHLNFGFFLDL